MFLHTGLVLYEENIAMLTESYLAIREKSSTVGVKQVNYSLSGLFKMIELSLKRNGFTFVAWTFNMQAKTFINFIVFFYLILTWI